MNPDGGGEVVWGDRIDPVRTRIANVPFPDSGFRFGDVVLHDGAPVGSRLDQHGRERAVFNVLELFQSSGYCTYEVKVEAAQKADIVDLETRCDAAHLSSEDWTATTRSLCRACSEGRLHERHDEEGIAEWSTERRVGIASSDDAVVADLLRNWAASGPGKAVVELRCALTA